MARVRKLKLVAGVLIGLLTIPKSDSGPGRQRQSVWRCIAIFCLSAEARDTASIRTLGRMNTAVPDEDGEELEVIQCLPGPGLTQDQLEAGMTIRETIQ